MVRERGSTPSRLEWTSSCSTTSCRDGLSILREIREKGYAMPVLFLSGFGDLEVVREALAAGANEYLPKPVGPAELRAALVRHVPGIDFREESAGSGRDEGRTEDAESVAGSFRARRGDGVLISARTVRYSIRGVVVECSCRLGCSEGDSLFDLEISLGRFTMEFPAARVETVTPLADSCLLEVALPGEWDLHERGGEGADSPAGFAPPPVGEGENSDRLPRDLVGAVVGLNRVLESIHEELEPQQAFFHRQDPDSRLAMESRLVERAEAVFFPALTQVVERYESAAERARESGLREVFRAYSHRVLYPLLLCSPFIARTIQKPLGVPGDYGMLGRILGNRFEGHSLFARVVNGWLLSTPAAEAYRHRIDLLEMTIRETVACRHQEGERASVLSVGSGVAFEVQRFLQSEEEAYAVDFTLMDFNPGTLAEANRRLGGCRAAASGAEVLVNLQRDSIVDLAKRARRAVREGEQHDLVYCTGLFDYFSDRMCRKIMGLLEALCRPGGRVVVSNFAPANPIRNFMDLVLDWELTYRDEAALREIVLGERNEARSRFIPAPGGVEIIAVLDNPE